MTDIDESFDELRRQVEPRVRQPDFAVIRTRHRRRVRNQRVATGTLAVVAITAGYGVADRALDDTAPRFGTAATVGDYVPPPTGEFGTRDVAFVDATQGWALGARCSDEAGGERCEMGVSRTTDGGDSWTSPARFGPVLPKDVLRTSTSPLSGAARSVRFFNSTVGYAFNPALYVTSDAGRSWRAVPVPDQVVGVTASSLGVLLTTWHCPPEGKPCMFRILRDREADGTLHELTTPLDAPVGADNAMLRVGGNEVWVLSYGKEGQRLEHSFDAGRLWQRVQAPCVAYDRQHFSVTNRTLWVVCSVVEDDRRSAKTVYVSPDGGKTWERRGTPDPLGVTNDLKAVSEDAAFLSSSHGDLLGTTDGGRTWQVVAEGEGYINLEFRDARRGWFFGPNGALWRYTDGKVERLAGPR